MKTKQHPNKSFRYYRELVNAWRKRERCHISMKEWRGLKKFLTNKPANVTLTRIVTNPRKHGTVRSVVYEYGSWQGAGRLVVTAYALRSDKRPQRKRGKVQSC